jgi:hypothetical protein
LVASSSEAHDTPPPTQGGGNVDPRLIFVLNLLAGACGGYFLLGQKQKGIAALVLFALLFIPPSCGTGSMIVALVTAVDGYLQAQQRAAARKIGRWTFFRSAV